MSAQNTEEKTARQVNFKFSVLHRTSKVYLLTACEFFLQDTVSQPDNARQTAAAVIITAAILILLPMLPGSANLGASNGFNL